MSALSELWCNWTHGGGIVLRDPSGRINWQCCKCARWATPVAQGEESAVTRSAAATMAQTKETP
jgi:hypothetical protein